MQGIPDGSTINFMFTVEARAVVLAFDFIRTSDFNNEFIQFSD